MSCGRGGSVKTLTRQVAEGQIKRESEDEAPDNVIPLRGQRPLPTQKQLRMWHKKLMANTRALRIMHEKRGLTDETLKKFCIGWDGQRFTVPIYDERGELVNVRRYKPNAREHRYKMISWGTGHGEARLFGFDLLADPEVKEVVLTEGEFDKIIGRQYNIPTVTHTGGAQTFKPEWAKHFKGKHVYVAYDEDMQGDKGFNKVRAILQPVAESVNKVELGTDIKGGDVTDFFTMGRSESDFRTVMSQAQRFGKPEKHKVPLKGKRVTIEESQNPQHEVIELTCMVAGKIEPPYLAPKKIVATCDQSAAAAKCASCFFAANGGERTIEFDPDDHRLLQTIGMSEKGQPIFYGKLTEAKCAGSSHVQFDVKETYSIEQLAISPSLDHRTEDTEIPITRAVFNVGTYKTPINQPAKIVGKQTADPRSSQGIIHGWNVEPVNTDLDNFRMTPEVKKRLLRFRPAQGQSPLEKCMEIADDLAANVTNIWGRPMMHVGYDLVWHSLVGFEFEGKLVPRGWLECLVLGDTRTGKSETAIALSKHYQAGIVKPLEGATFAGLVGGNDKVAGTDRYMVKWGLIPLNDRRLVVLDEMSGLFGKGNRESKGIIEEMSSIRSEGKAQISKIASAETSARTRLIWISNPLSSTSLADSSNGCLPALRQLVPQPEDIARYDFVMACTSKDVPSSVINSTKHRRVRHRATSKISHELIMWAWSRKSHQVKFLTGVEEYIYAAAEDLGSRYDPDPPLIQIANVRIKVARLAVAFAARTFSSDAKGECLVVKRAHVKSAVEFLDSIYGELSMGYKRHSEMAAENRRKAEKAKTEARQYLAKNPGVVEVLIAIGGTQFKKRDFEEFGDDETIADVIIPKLVKWRMIRRKDKGYMVMEPALIELLRELEDAGG